MELFRGELSVRGHIGRKTVVVAFASVLALGACGSSAKQSEAPRVASANETPTSAPKPKVKKLPKTTTSKPAPTTVKVTTPPPTAPRVTAPPPTAPPATFPPQTAPPAPVANNCTPGYDPCLPPASDYDCAGGSGNGPSYTGYVTVTGPDIYDLDRDGDGSGCE